MTTMRAFRSAARRWRASGNVATQSAEAPAVERRTRDVHRAVPVPLGLDDRPQLGAAGSAQQRFGVSPDRPEVEGEARALHY